MRHRVIDTFTGKFVIVQNSDGSVKTTWLNAQGRDFIRNSKHDDTLLPDLADRLTAYFDGRTVKFDSAHLPDRDSFAARCLRACQQIPRGQTRTYAQLAAMAGGKPGSSRAAGQAMRNNPLPIVVPCHRVIGSDGKLHGFAGTCDPKSSALDLKRSLLKLEGYPA